MFTRLSFHSLNRIVDKVRFQLDQNILFWLRLGIVIGVIGLSAGLAYKGSARLFRLIIILVPVIAATITLLRIPNLGLLALIASILIPMNGPSNSNATMVLVLLFFGLWVLEMILIQGEIRFVPSSANLPLVALLVSALVSFGVGQLPWYTFIASAPLGAQLGGLSLYILSACAFWLVANRIYDQRWLAWLTWLFIAISAIQVAGWLFPPLNRINSHFFTVQTTGSLFWMWGLALTFSQALFNDELQRVWRVGLAAVAMAIAYVGLVDLRAWNSGWMPGLVAVLVIIWAAKPRVGFGLTLVGLAAGLYKSRELIAAIMIGDNEYSLGTRLDAWAIVWNITKVSPIFGLGPANYNAYTPLFPIRGWAVTFNSHNQYVDLIAQTGIVGLICFLWFFLTVGWIGWQLRGRVPAGFLRAYVYGAIGGVAGTLVSAAFGDWVIPFFYNINLGGFRASMLSWLFLGGLIALGHIVATDEEEAEVSPTNTAEQPEKGDALIV